MQEAVVNSDSGLKTIFVVDDEEQVRTYLSSLLRRSGYKVLSASDGESALHQAREYPGAIHLLLSDFEMSGMSGVDLATKLNAERPNTHVLLMSGYAGGMLILNDGWTFLNKPFVPSQLRALISKIVDHQK